MYKVPEQVSRFSKELIQPIKRGIKVIIISSMLLGPVQAVEAGNRVGDNLLSDETKTTEIDKTPAIPIKINPEDKVDYQEEYQDITESVDEINQSYPFLSQFIKNISLKPELSYQGREVYGLAYIYQPPSIAEVSQHPDSRGSMAFLELSLQNWRMTNPNFSPDVKDRSVLLEEIGHLLDLSPDNILVRTALTPEELNEVIRLRTKALDLYRQKGKNLLCNPYENPDLIDHLLVPDDVSIDKEVAAEGFQLLYMKDHTEFTTPYPRFFGDLMLTQNNMDPSIPQAFMQYWETLMGKLNFHYKAVH